MHHVEHMSHTALSLSAPNNALANVIELLELSLLTLSVIAWINTPILKEVLTERNVEFVLP